MQSLGKKPHFWPSQRLKKVLLTKQGCEAAHWPNNNANPSGLSEKKDLLCRKARYVRSLGEKPHFWPSQRLKKVLLTTQGVARLRTGPIIMQIPRGYHKKKFIVQKGAICAILREKTPFLAFPEAKKGVVNYARLRTGPIIMQIPRGYHKKKFIV